MQTADLSGYVCVVTGGRVRIGYQICLKLLRAGATVIATSRWPHDTVLRFAQESGMSTSDYYVLMHYLTPNAPPPPPPPIQTFPDGRVA